jgi:hypothetical protein
MTLAVYAGAATLLATYDARHRLSQSSFNEWLSRMKNGSK